VLERSKRPDRLRLSGAGAPAAGPLIRSAPARRLAARCWWGAEPWRGGPLELPLAGAEWAADHRPLIPPAKARPLRNRLTPPARSPGASFQGSVRLGGWAAGARGWCGRDRWATERRCNPTCRHRRPWLAQCLSLRKGQAVDLDALADTPSRPAGVTSGCQRFEQGRQLGAAAGRHR